MENRILSLIDKKTTLDSNQRDIIKKLLKLISFKNKYIIKDNKLFLKKPDALEQISKGEIDKDLDNLSLSYSEDDINMIDVNMIDVRRAIESTSDNVSSETSSISDSINKLGQIKLACSNKLSSKSVLSYYNKMSLLKRMGENNKDNLKNDNKKDITIEKLQQDRKNRENSLKRLIKIKKQEILLRQRAIQYSKNNIKKLEEARHKSAMEARQKIVSKRKKLAEEQRKLDEIKRKAAIEANNKIIAEKKIMAEKQRNLEKMKREAAIEINKKIVYERKRAIEEKKKNGRNET